MASLTNPVRPKVCNSKLAASTTLALQIVTGNSLRVDVPEETDFTFWKVDYFILRFKLSRSAGPRASLSKSIFKEIELMKKL